MKATRNRIGLAAAGLRFKPRSGIKRWLFFFFWVLVCSAFFWRSIAILGSRALQDENVSHIFLIPLISAWLMIAEQRETPAQPRIDCTAFLLFLLPGLLLFAWTTFSVSLDPNEHLTVSILAVILFVISGFVFLFGRGTTRALWFPLAFLLFAVPLPNVVLDRVIYWLQSGSAAVAELFFNLSGYPVLREGFVFRLPRISIEVARECSGIRSSIALLILAVLVAHFSFRSFWKKAIFVGAGLVMMIVKNGIRIATLTLLANYVNPDFLYGKLHQRGGVVFFLLGLALLVPVFWLLRIGEDLQSLSSAQGPNVKMSTSP